jgi:hypothetical protein
MEKTLGQIGYEAYAQSTGGKTFDGREMPTWQEIKDREGETPKVTTAWEAAAGAVARFAINGVAVRESLRSANKKERQLFENGRNAGLDAAFDAVFKEILRNGGKGVDSLEALAIDYHFIAELRSRLASSDEYSFYHGMAS